MVRSRFLCTKVANNPHQWSIKQISKSNFSESLEELKSHIFSSDFVAVSLQKTGSFSAPWHRVLPFDTADTAYFKSKYAAERFQVLQFAVCPFSIKASKVVAYPYNFHLFPRDELKMGMPSYSFSCQTSYLTSMAREGFDFNACIYDGISYLSRSQESAAKNRMGNPRPVNHDIKFSSTPSIADTIFIERIKSRVKHWRNACNDSSKKIDEALVSSLRKLVLGSEEYKSRPSINIDVCSERQVQLTLEMLREIFSDLVPLIIPARGGGTQAVRVVLTKSKEDKDLLERELQSIEEQQNKTVCGFREVIDLISASQKPVVSHNSLNDFTFIHAKFLAPLPPNMNDFICSLRLVFPHILDVNHLMKEVGPMKKVTNLPAAIHNLKRRYFLPIDMEIPQQGEEPSRGSHHEMFVNDRKQPFCLSVGQPKTSTTDANEGKNHGHNVVRISELFAKLSSILKIHPDTPNSANDHSASSLESYGNIFSPCSARPLEASDGDISVWTNSTRKVSCEDLVFLWGFRSSMSAAVLKAQLQQSHNVFSEEFDVRLVNKSCAIIVFRRPGLSDMFLEVMGSEEICDSLREMVSEGLRAAGYETYKRICRLGFWEAELADSLDKASADPELSLEADSETKSSEVQWSCDNMIYFDDL